MKTRMTRLRRALIATAACVVSGVAVSGCTPDLSSMSVPTGGSNAGTYKIHIEFANVLNLPTGADVMVDGTSVGRLSSLRIDDRGFVVADATIDSTVELDSDTTATLQQSAPLADVHISLRSDDSSGGSPLQAGDTIPLSRTAQAPQIEDTLAKLAMSIGQGTFTDLLSTVRQLNKAFPEDPKKTAAIFDNLGTNLDDLAAHQDALDAVLDGFTVTMATITDNSAVIDPLLTPEGSQHTTDAMKSTLGIVFMMTNLGLIAPPAQWVAPILKSADDLAGAVLPVLYSGSPLDTSQPSNLRNLVDFLHNKVIPFAAAGPKVNVTEVEVNGPGGSTLKLPAKSDSDQIMTTLRMIGLIR